MSSYIDVILLLRILVISVKSPGNSRNEKIEAVMRNLRALLVIIQVFWLSTVLAQQPGSIMYSNEPAISSGQSIYSSSPNIHKGDEQSKHCTELARKVEALKGKPQQRYAASERYKMECTNRE